MPIIMGANGIVYRDIMSYMGKYQDPITFTTCKDRQSWVQHISWDTYIYRPQTKFVKVMFLHVSVNHSVHRGNGIPSCIAASIPAGPAGLQGWWYPSVPCRSPSHTQAGI